jgi:uncharacterized coiled-coil protein SlyX
MMDKELKGKRLLKRVTLEAAVERAEKDRHAHLKSELIWTGTTKASLQRQAGIGKNYIDLLAPDDELVNRIKLLLRRAETSREKRDVEKIRLERIRQLESQLSIQARENHELMGQLNRTRSDLERMQSRISVYERHYEKYK